MHGAVTFSPTTTAMCCCVPVAYFSMKDVDADVVSFMLAAMVDPGSHALCKCFLQSRVVMLPAAVYVIWVCHLEISSVLFFCSKPVACIHDYMPDNHSACFCSLVYQDCMDGTVYLQNSMHGGFGLKHGDNDVHTATGTC